MEEWKDIGNGYMLSSLGRLYSKNSNRYLKPGKNNTSYVYHIQFGDNVTKKAGIKKLFQKVKPETV